MNALADEEHKQGMPQSDMHALHNTAILHATTAYLGMVIE